MSDICYQVLCWYAAEGDQRFFSLFIILFLLVDSCVPGDLVTITGVAKVTTSEESKKINV